MICQINTCNEKNLLLEVFSFFKTHGTERVKKKKSTTILFERIQTDQNEAF